MEAAEVKVGGAAGGLAAVFRGVGWLVFAILTGRKFSTNKIHGGLRLVVGSIVFSALIGAVIGSYYEPYPEPPLGFTADPLAYFRLHGDTWGGTFGGAFAGLALGLFLMFLTDESALEEARKFFKKNEPGQRLGSKTEPRKGVTRPRVGPGIGADSSNLPRMAVNGEPDAPSADEASSPGP